MAKLTAEEDRTLLMEVGEMLGYSKFSPVQRGIDRWVIYAAPPGDPTIYTGELYFDGCPRLRDGYFGDAPVLPNFLEDYREPLEWLIKNVGVALTFPDWANAFMLTNPRDIVMAYEPSLARAVCNAVIRERNVRQQKKEAELVEASK